MSKEDDAALSAEDLEGALEETNEVEDEEALEAFRTAFAAEEEHGAVDTGKRREKVDDDPALGMNVLELGDESDEEREAASAAALVEKDAEAGEDEDDDADAQAKKAAADAEAKAGKAGKKAAAADGADDGDKSESVEERLARIEADTAKRIRTLEGRYGELNRSFQTLAETTTKAAKEVKAAGEAAPTDKQLKEALVDVDKMAKLKSEFPEFADALEDGLTKARASLPDVAKIEGDVMEKVQTALAEERAILTDMVVGEDHENWVDTIISDRFGAWLDAQDTKTKALERSNNPMDVKKLLDSYAPFAAWIDQQGSLQDDHDDKELLDLYSKSAVKSGSTAEEVAAKKEAARLKRLGAAVPATVRSRSSRPDPVDENQIFRDAFNS